MAFRLFFALSVVKTLLLICFVSGERRVIIRYKEDGFLEEALALAWNRTLNMNITSRKLLALTLLDDAIYNRLEQNPNVEYIEEDHMRGALWLRDLLLPEVLQEDREIVPYGITMVQADQVWRLPPSRSKVTVCVVDSGMALGHRDLPGVIHDGVRGTDTENGSWHDDVDGHGTHTVGTIGAVGDNGIGIAGVNQDPNLYVLHIGRGLDDEGYGSTSTTLAAVEGCIDNGAKVISLSLGGTLASRSEREYYDYLWNEGILVVAAAGNDGNAGHNYPASLPSVMSVGAVNRLGRRPDFSQCNDQVEIAAPGVDVLSTIPRQRFAFASGTSMACPHVAGVAAQVWSHFPNCSNAQIRNVLLRTANHLGELEGCTQDYGWGLIQSRAAYDMLQEEGCEAGGDFEQSPNGGCAQNPDYVAEENPNRNFCSSPRAPMATWKIVVICLATLGFLLFIGAGIYIYRADIEAFFESSEVDHRIGQS